MARSAVADHGRKRTRFHRFLKAFRIERPSPPPDNESLKVALDKLSPQKKQLIEWKYEDLLSIATIATRLKISEKAAENRLTRARNSLRKLYRP